MAQSKLELLKQVEKELLEELAKVRDLMAPYEITQSDSNTNTSIKKEKKERAKAEGISRGIETWDNYVQLILRELGGKGKAQDVINYAIKANPRVPKDTIYDAVRGRLSKLYRDGVISATVPENKKDGYVYHIVKAQPTILLGNNATA